MRTTERIAGIAAFAVALPVLTASPAPAAQPPDKVTVNVVSAIGSGCPAGTVAAAVADDNGTLTITFTSGAFTARAGGASIPTDSRKNCLVSLHLGVPEDHTYGIKRVDHYGSANLEPEASGSKTSNYYFQGMAQTGRSTNALKGPHNGGWQFEESINTEWQYRPCYQDRNLNIGMELRVSLGTSDPLKVSSMSIGSPGGSTKYTLAWKTCP